MLTRTRVKDMSFLLNLNDVRLRYAVHQLHQMVKSILACVFKPSSSFVQVMPHAQLHSIGKKRLCFESSTRQSSGSAALTQRLH